MREERVLHSRGSDDYVNYVENGERYDHYVVINFYSDDGKLLDSLTYDSTASGKINWGLDEKNGKLFYENVKRKAELKEQFEKEKAGKAEPTGEAESTGEAEPIGEAEPTGEAEPKQEEPKQEEPKQEDNSNKKEEPKKPLESNPSGGKGSNITDPKVIFDPTIKLPTIVRKYYGVSYNYKKTEDDMYSNVNNEYNVLKIEGIEYPLIVINSQSIEQRNITYMSLKLEGFLPTISLTIFDDKEFEQKIQTTNMNGTIEVCISARVDKVYKPIRLHFQILSVKINPINPKEIIYTGEYTTEKFQQVNTGFLKKDQTKANFYELLYVIAQKCGLGFAATDATADVNDRCLRNVFTQRYDDYIQKQLTFAGCDSDSILDAWIDPYNYIVLTNVSWVMNKDIKTDELSIIAICGFPSTDRDVPDPKPKELKRVLTNFNNMTNDSNLFIKSYSMIINNDAIVDGTLERIYTVNWNDSNVTLLDTTDIQTKQNSVDGEYLSEYNTGSNRPLPRFNFNEGGYDLNTQKIIRNHYFNKHRQQILKVKLKYPNLGLQRGTLVGIAIWEQDAQLKEIMLSQPENLKGDMGTVKKDFTYKDENNLTDAEIVEAEGLQAINMKLTDLYYIDSILFEYSNKIGEIEETLFLIKKGDVSGYNNYHSFPKSK